MRPPYPRHRSIRVTALALALTAVFSSACTDRPEGGNSGGNECGSGAACAPPAEGPVPDVIGMAAPRACRSIDRLGYGASITSIDRDSNLQPGHVIRTDPEAGVNAGEGGRVNLYVAGPWEPVGLPDACSLEL